MNPFTVQTTNVINMSTGHYADNDVKDNLINAKQLGLQARRLFLMSQQNLKTAVVVAAIYAVRRWVFHKDETNFAVGRRYRNHLPSDIPTDTDSIHFSCDRYNPLSLKYVEQLHRYARSRSARQFEIS